MPTLHIEPIAAFSDNYIWAIHDGASAWLVDPGEYAPCAAFLQRNTLQLAGILLTHHHNDHQGGIPQLLALKAVEVIGPRKENIAVVSQAVIEGDWANLAPFGVRLQVIEVPGHTSGHIAFFGMINDVPQLFCGDTLFAGGCGRLFEGTPPQMWQSLQKLAALPGETAVYCAHEYTLSNLAFAHAAEPASIALAERIAAAKQTRAAGRPTLPSSIALERATNPFLRAAEPELMRSAAVFAGEPVNDPVQSFAALRKWKDGFKAPSA